MSKNRSEITVIEDGGLIFKGSNDNVRTGFLTMAKSALLIVADNIDSMEQHGYLANAEDLKVATQSLYDVLMKEADLKVKMSGRGLHGRFELVPRGRRKPDTIKPVGAV